MNETLESNPAALQQAAYDVIVAGAGPVGLFLACELALAGCSVMVLEKAEDPHSPLKQMPFGLRGLNALSIEALYRRGLLEELEVPKNFTFAPTAAPAGVKAKVKPGGHFAGLQFQLDKVDATQWPYRLPSSTETLLMAELQELEMVLARRAESLGVTIRRGLAIVNFEQTPDLVTVQAGNQVWQGQWLVGCDGARSAVRKLGGFAFDGTEPEFTGYSATVELADPEKLQPGRTLTPAGMYWLQQPTYLIMQNFDGGAFHQSQQPITREYLQELLRRISGTDVTITALHIATAWTDRARQATAYHHGRVLLAGDAAHIHSPLGGQGLNLGLGDAMNLGWKLAATIQGQAPVGLLDSYYSERHPVGAQVLDWSRAQVAIMQPTPQAQAVRGIIQDLLNIRDGATYFAGRVWGLTTHYDLGGTHFLVGHSAPNFLFEDGSTLGELLCDGRGILLDFDGNVALQMLSEEYGPRLKYVTAKPQQPLGLNALLIRPDGFVAWATDGAPDAQAIRQVAVRWFVGSSNTLL
ncbi:FAD-dependent monooxygenase [Hymenobacter wooponensis]|uniref:FAD-dependent oxidoreductase n=1 Tax=Hymenobacter wooponensis TaxID=1525360 RepID=A0A4Z0MT41_9BACT|nr:FAD-dependent monooxygenase [Hymenobacter wooponensis]TGD82488.1 FAD-dependent oxidoreductase [Hymenobacter wooponensis]